MLLPDLLEQTVCHVVARHNSLEVAQLLRILPEEPEDAASAFCDRFELGNWFYEALVLNEADIGKILDGIGRYRITEEYEAAEERRERQYELQN